MENTFDVELIASTTVRVVVTQDILKPGEDIKDVAEELAWQLFWRHNDHECECDSVREVKL